MDDAKTNLPEPGSNSDPRKAPIRPDSANRGDSFASLASNWRGRVRIADDFDDLPADLAESFGIGS